MGNIIKASVFIAVSLDGFIARENGELDWLNGSENETIGSEINDDFGYKKFIDSIDTIVMGRNTFQSVLTFQNWPYGSKKVIVLSNTLEAISDNLALTVELRRGSAKELIIRLQKEGAKHIYVDGGKTIQAFLNEGLIDELIITRLPVIIGKGISLFGEFDKDIKLKHLETTSFLNGFVQSKYQVLH
jgi:dihydrofolate reductase